MFEFEFIINENRIVPNSPINQDYSLQVYEVIRFIDGIPVFYDEHFNRFKSSCATAGVDFSLDKDLFAKNLIELAKDNNVQNCNLKYCINVYHESKPFFAGFIRSTYPSIDMYNNGVPVGILQEERPNPNAKIQNKKMRKRADELIHDKNLFEVALANRNNEITEGSKSNLFFIDGEANIFTAPLSMVLGGITRQVIIEEINRLEYNLILEAVPVGGLDAIVAAFISGTSPSVLPISKIGNHHCQLHNEVVEKIKNAYQSRVLADINSFRAKF